MAARPQHHVRYCSKCRLPVRGHVGPTGEKCTQPSSNFVADLPPELQTIQTELEASICKKEEEIANLSAELHHLNFTELLQLQLQWPIRFSQQQYQSFLIPFKLEFHFTPSSAQDQPHLGHMVSGHVSTVAASFSSYLQSSTTTLASFSAPGSSSLSIPAGNSTSWGSFPPHCPAGVSASSSSSGAVSLSSFSLTHSTETNSVFPHVPVSSTASLASFSVANAPSRPASVSCQTSSCTGTIFSVSNLPGIFPAQVCVPQSSGLSCPHYMQSASITVPQQQCYYIPTPLIMPVTSSPQSAPQFAPVQPSYPVTASAPVPSEPTTRLITIFQELLKKISQHGSEPTTIVSSSSPVASPVAPSVAPPAPTHHPHAPTMTDLRKDPALTSQADAIIASLPILSSLASTKGKNKSDLSFMSTIKCPPNAFLFRVPIPSRLHLDTWHHLLSNFSDNVTCEFLELGWPINYTSPTPPTPVSHNHPFACNHPDDVLQFIAKEVHLQATTGPFSVTPSHATL